jgi:hypothetical protein
VGFDGFYWGCLCVCLIFVGIFVNEREDGSWMGVPFLIFVLAENSLLTYQINEI